MKLSIKILSAMFIFAVIGMTSCSKNQFGINADNSEFTENTDNSETLVIKNEVTKEEMLKDLREKGKIISVENNYVIPETKLTGTLYKYSDYKGNEKQFVLLDKKPSDNDLKGLLPHIMSVTHMVTGYWGEDGIFHITSEWYECSGSNTGCFGYTNFFIVY